MEFQDKQLTCEDCGNEFTFTAGEQEFYQEKGFDNEPRRCPDCREKRKMERRSQRVETPITCSECGKEDTVPFVPTEGRPVLCRDCFAKSRA
jgi:CxxC-x17-CxxC domain-containing protein